MMRQIKLFLCAVQFLTRIPVPHLAGFEGAWITRSARYFPLVGQIVGGLAAAALLLANEVWQGVVPLLLALTAGILLTGAFHEDGLADTADGLGGGRDAAHRLTIMKDSRIGTFGALALVLLLALKLAGLALFNPGMAALLLLASHGMGRTAAVVVMGVLPYAGDPAASKTKPVPDGVRGGEVLLALLFGAWPLLLLPAPLAIYGLVGGVFLALLIALTARRLINGYTGDVLGAVEQVFELGFVLGAAAVL
ncbi:MAG: adenosylcobinamide-GDP ribazoletransferase [Rhodospirillaceae bacterium]|nr:adenosylcobinamide-GDP ribazoletransferase [Rhodospirillaceae bacterium]